MNIYVRMKGFEETKALLERLPRRFIGALEQATRLSTDAVAEQARQNIFAQFRNGRRMADAIGTRITRRGSSVTGTVGFGETLSPDKTALPYMEIQERGGVVRHPGVFGRLMVFEPNTPIFGAGGAMDGDVVFTTKVAPHDIPIPARPFLRPALKQREAEILRIFQREVQESVEAERGRR